MSYVSRLKFVNTLVLLDYISGCSFVIVSWLGLKYYKLKPP